MTRLQTLTAVLLVAAVAVCAQAAWHEGFETRQDPSWRHIGGDGSYRILDHRRIQADAHAGSGCEWLRVEAAAGSRVDLVHEVGSPPVIDELVPSVWVKSDRAGLQLSLRIALPRTLDSRSGRPLVTTVSENVFYTETGRWQQLRLEGVPRLLARQARILRMQLGPQVDEREARLEAVTLSVYGEPGATNVWIDDLEVAGYVPGGDGRSQPDGTSQTSQNVSAAWNAQAKDMVPLPPPSATSAAAPKHTVRLTGSVLLVDDRPMFPRAIQYRGESPAVLKQLGFNALWLERLPTPELLAEADRLGLWLICPPPAAPTAAGAASAVAEIGPALDGVLVWNVGENLAEAELEAVQRWAEIVRAADQRRSRPLVCCPRRELRGYSRVANLLLLDRRPLGTSMEMTDYAAWVRQQPLLASPGTPIWTVVQTQPNATLRRQLAAIEPGSAPPTSVAPEQIRLLAYTAVASGSRGLLFASDSPLDAADPDTKRRAMTLESLNLELALIEPWAAAGGGVATASASVPEVTGVVLHAEHARLLLPLWFSPGAQYVPSQSAVNGLRLVTPGAPEASNAYELTPSGVQRLRRERITGGLAVTLEEFGLTAQVLLAQDPLIIDAVHRRAAGMGRRAAELQRQLATQRFSDVQTVAARLTPRTKVRDAVAWFDAARQYLQSCNRRLAAGDWPGAATDAQRVGRALRLVERAYWDGAVKQLTAPITSPAALGFSTLPCHWRLIDRLAGGRFGPNLVAGGDFEDIEAMMRAGWRYTLETGPNVRTAADLTPQAARSGLLGLRLAVTPLDPKSPPAAIESPPLRFTSPVVQIEAGRIFCVHGWARVPAPVKAGIDGLLVFDSFSGEALADRIDQTADWREFALYRVATQSGPMSVTFALSGLGEAWIDDVAVQVLDSLPGATQH